MARGLEVRVLGPVEVRRDGRPLPIGGPKPRLLLAYLLAHRGSVVSVDRLCDACWNDDPPANPPGVLQSHLSRLRPLLRPDAEIAARPPGYVLTLPDDHVDAGRFESLCAQAKASADLRSAADALRAALASWRGAAFEEFADRDWARQESVRLEEQRVKAEEDLAEVRLALGEHAEVVADLESLVAAHPLRERPWQLLVIALYRCNRPADALRRATRLRTLLREDLGLEPSPTLRDLEARVLADDPSLLLPSVSPPSPSRHRLPADTTELVGRDAELGAAIARLREHRLTTLTGPGGVGKTRLALHLLRDLAAEFDGEVFFTELAPARDESSTLGAIAGTVDVQPRQHLSLEETLLEHLRVRQAWLVLDNCEHVRGAVAPLVDRLLSWCPDLRVLATSREVLGLPGEHVWRLGPLGVPEPGADGASVAKAPAVRLFVDRAAAARPGFALGPENVDAVAEVVRRVDGLPLAIELAAARMGAMSAAALAQRLDDRFDLLGGAQALNARHRTLHDLVAWSHDLLDPDEQQVFARLVVFPESFGLDAAEGVCAGAGVTGARVSALLANLVDKSMVQLVDADGALPRYRLLETLREFGRGRLGDDAAAAIRAQHARWYLELAEEGGERLSGEGESDAIAILDRDFDNFRAAHRWAIEQHDVDLALRLTAALREWSFRRMQAEVISWADAAVALDGSEDHPRAPVVIAAAAYGRFVRGDLEGAIELGWQALVAGERTGTGSSGLAERALGNAYFYRGESDDGTAWMDRMVASAREGSAARLAHALYMRSVAFTSVGDSVRGAQLAGEARAAAVASGSPTAHAQAAYAFGLALEATDPVEAGAHLQRAADLARGAGNRWVEAFARTEVLWLDARQGQPREALARYADVVDTWYRGGDWANQWLSLRHVFGILVQLHAHLAAATLHGALTAAGAAYALPFEAADAGRLAALVGDLRVHLGPAQFAAAVRRGAALTDAEIIAFVQEQIRALSA